MIKPVCPHCSALLSKTPQRKTSCKICRQDIYVRTHPQDRSKVFTTEQGAKEIDALWLDQHQERVLIDRYALGFEAERALLSVKFGAPPKDRDVLWSLILKERQKHSGARQWGLYRNVTLDMADLLVLDDKHSSAAPHLVDVCCLDLWLDAQLAHETSTPFRSSDSLAPGVVDKLSKCLTSTSVMSDALPELIANRLTKLPMLARWGNAKEVITDAICGAVRDS